MASIVVDSNLLVLLVVGGRNRCLIEKHKRTKTFAAEDYDLLVSTLAPFSSVYLTPHIVTETSNLLAQIGEPHKSELHTFFGQLIPGYREHIEYSELIVGRAEFPALGVADSAILDLIENDKSLITADLDLYLSASRLSSNVYNFNHIRQGQLVHL